MTVEETTATKKKSNYKQYMYTPLNQKPLDNNATLPSHKEFYEIKPSNTLSYISQIQNILKKETPHVNFFDAPSPHSIYESAH